MKPYYLLLTVFLFVLSYSYSQKSSSIFDFQNRKKDSNVEIISNTKTNSFFVKSIKNSLFEFELFDVLGKIVYQSKAYFNRSIDLNHLKKGPLLLRIHSNNAIITRKLIVK